MDDKNFDIDEPIEELDDAVEELESPVESLQEDYPEESYQTQEEKPQHFGQEEYNRRGGDKNYYKEKQKEYDAAAKEAKAKSKEAKQKAEDAKQKANVAKQTQRNAKDAKKSDGSSASKENYKAAKNNTKEAKGEAKEAKAKSKEANREYRGAKMDSFGNKIDAAKSSAYRMAHPIESTKTDLMNKIKNRINNAKEAAKDKVKTAAKDAAKKTGKAVAKGAKAAGKAAAAGAKAAGHAVAQGFAALASNPYFWAVVGGIALVLGIIMMVVILIGAVVGVEEEANSSGIDQATVNYDVNGVNSDTRVEMLSSEGSVLDTINIESYSLGVALFELGTDYQDEALKAQIVLTRSYLLSKGVTDTTKNVIQVKQSDDELVYWNYRKDLYRKDVNGNYIYSPEYDPTVKAEKTAATNSDGKVVFLANDTTIEDPYRKALTSDEISKAELIASEVVGRYVTDEAGNPISVKYKESDVLALNKSALNNSGTENGKYNALIMNQYPDVSKVEDVEYEMIYYGDVGEFSNWKQKTKLGAPWGDIQLGTNSGTTIDSIGCLVTSISMQIAYSGVKTGNITDFNPGTFAKAAKAQGCFSAGGGINSYDCLAKVVPAFKYAGRLALDGNNEARYQTIKQYANKGYFIVIEVRKHGGGQHWVALDVKNSAAISWKDIYIWDPATTKTKISDKMNYKANTILYFTK